MAEIDEILADFNKQNAPQQEVHILNAPTSKKTRHLNFLLEPEIYTLLQKYAQDKNIDTSKAIRQILIEALQKGKGEAGV